MTRDRANNPHDIEGPGASFPATPVRGAMPDWYPGLLDAVAGHVFTGRTRAISAVNQQLVATYWAIGKDLLEREGLEGWGARLSCVSLRTFARKSQVPVDSRPATCAT